MKRPGKRFLRIVAGVVLIPPLVWGAILLFLPMGWARARIESALSRSTRQEVRLASVRLLPLGGVELSGLEMAAPGASADPWAKVAGLSIDVSARDLLVGRVEPTAVRAWGVSLRVRRDATGRLEFADMLAPDPKADPAAPAAPAGPEDEGREVQMTLEDGAVTVVDESTDTRLDLTGVRALALADASAITLTQLSGGLNGGTFEAAARLDRRPSTAIEAQIQARDVALGVGMKSLAYLIPLLAPDSSAAEGHARGTLALDATLKARGETGDALAKSLTGRGTVALDELNLDDSRILDEVQSLLPVPTRGKLGSLRGGFTIADRRVTTADTVLKVAEIPVDLAGWSDFDGHLNYLVKCEKLGKAVSKLTDRLSSDAKEILGDLPVGDLKHLTDVRVSGTIDRPTVKPAEGSILAPKSAQRDPARRASDKAKLKEAGRRLLDRVVR